MSAVRPPPKNDYVPPAPLPGSLRRSAAGGASAGAGAGAAAQKVAPADYLDKAEAEWNERVDKEVSGLATGLEQLVKGFGVEPNQASSQQHALPLASLSLGLVHAGLLKNAQNLLKITHDLKLLHLLAPEPGTATATAAVAGQGVEGDEELERLRGEVAALEKEFRGAQA